MAPGPTLPGEISSESGPLDPELLQELYQSECPYNRRGLYGGPYSLKYRLIEEFPEYVRQVRLKLLIY